MRDVGTYTKSIIYHRGTKMRTKKKKTELPTHSFCRDGRCEITYIHVLSISKIPEPTMHYNLYYIHRK